MSISVSSGSILGSLYKNQVGEQSYYTGKYSKRTMVENQSVTKSLSSDLDFRKALHKLKASDFSIGLRADIKKAAKALVKGYNEFQESSGDGSKQYAKYAAEMKKLFKEHSSELSKAGISFESDKLKFDSERFDSAGNEALEKVFGKDGSLIPETEKIIKRADRVIGNNQFSHIKEDVFISNTVNSSNIAYASHTNALAVLTDRLNSTTLTDSNEEMVVEMINDYTSRIAEFYKELSNQSQWQDVEISSEASGKFEELIQLNEEYIEAIDRSSKGEAFEYDKWFSMEDASYGKRVNGLYKDLFAAFVNASAKGFEINSFVDYSI